MSRGFAIEGGYTLLDGEITEAGFDQSGTGFFVDGAALLRRPSRSANVRVAWHHAAGHEASVGAVHTGRRDDLDYGTGGRAVLAAYTTVDAAIHLQAIRRGAAGRNVSITARASNLLGERYQAVLGFATPGRALEIGLRMD
jgi:outer membrane cobalamin receptor